MYLTFLSFFHYKYISSTNKLQLWSIQHIIYAIVCVFPKNLQVYSSHLHVIQYIHAFLIRREIHSSHNMFNFLLWKTIFSPDFLEFKPTVLLLLRHAPTSLTSMFQFSNHFFFLKQMTKVQRFEYIPVDTMHIFSSYYCTQGHFVAQGGWVKSSPVKGTFCSSQMHSAHCFPDKNILGEFMESRQVELSPAGH